MNEGGYWSFHDEQWRWDRLREERDALQREYALRKPVAIDQDELEILRLRAEIEEAQREEGL